MAEWNYKIRLRHLFTEEEDHEAVQASMNSLADEIEKHSFFGGFDDVAEFRTLPQCKYPVEYANSLLARMYDYADSRRIWIE